MARWCGLVFLAGSFMLGALPAQAQDITFGGDARAFSMGGAGIASLAGSNAAGMGTRNNPAALAFARGLARFHIPNVGVRTTGAISLEKAASYLATNGSATDANALARRFAAEDSSFGINASTGLRIGPLEIMASGVAKGYVFPNASLQNWGKSGGFGAVPADARADILAASVYSLPQVGLATKLKGGDENFSLAVGGRLKYMNAVYAHYVADRSTLEGGGSASALYAPEMQGKSTLTKQGVGLDLGVMVESKKLQGLSGGLVIANAIKPSFTFTGQFGYNASGGGGMRTYNLLATTATAGVGFQRGGMTAVADVVDITRAIGATQLRAGIEQRLGPLALRAGYNSASGTTYGIGIGGFDLALGKRVPLEVVRTLRF